MPASGPREFPTTRWTLVLASSANDLQAKQALEWLCERYWQPLHAYAARRCGDPELARDLTQDFLAELIERNWLQRADPERGRFRSYLLGALKHFLADRYDRARAQKRGGGAVLVSADQQPDGMLEVSDDLTPELLYERQWAVTLMARVMDHLREDFARSGKISHFERLQPFLTGDAGYEGAAAALGMNEGAVRVAVHRLRKQLKQRLHDEIAETVAKPEDVVDEIRYLLEVLRQAPR
jgi:RNA polymerase sigma factor (sigma-70 family)